MKFKPNPKPVSRQAASLRPGQFKHVLRVASVSGRQSVRDVMLLWITHTTGIRVTELALIQIRDIMHPSGALRDEVYLRGAITKHGTPRVVYLTHPKAVAAVIAWLDYRISRGWQLGESGLFRGFVPSEKLVLTHKGRSFELARKRRVIESGPVEYLCCDALQQTISRIYRRAGIKGGSSHSGRRTLASRVLAQTGRIEDVQQVLGHIDVDHSWPYLDVDPMVIRRAFEIAL